MPLVPKPVEVRDFANRQQFATLFGDAVTAGRSDNVSTMFQYGVSSRDVKSTISGSGVISAANEMANPNISGAVGSAEIASRDPVRYRTGHEAVAQFTSLFEGMQSGVKHYHGLLNSSDGAAFGSQDGAFGIWLIAGGVETFTEQSCWNIDKCDGTGRSGFNLDPTKLNIYMVQYGWLGIAPILYSVYAGYLRGWVLVHVVDKVNTISRPHLHNPSLPLACKVVRASGSGTAAGIKTASWRAGVVAAEGAEANSANRWNAYTVLDISVTAAARNNVFTLKNAATFQGKSNHVVAEIGIVTFDNALNKTAAFYGVSNATLSGNSAYTDIDAASSVISVSTGGLVTAGTRVPATVVKAGGDRRTEVLGTGILIYPGDTFTFECVPAAAANGTISLSARWIEYF